MRVSKRIETVNGAGMPVTMPGWLPMSAIVQELAQLAPDEVLVASEWGRSDGGTLLKRMRFEDVPTAVRAHVPYLSAGKLLVLRRDGGHMVGYCEGVIRG